MASPTETIPARGNIIADVFSPNIFIFSSCLLVCIRFLDDKIPKSVAKIAKRLSDAGLGIYLWHVVIIHLFAFIFPTPHLNLFLWVFILSLGNYLLGFLCSSLQSLTWKKMKQLLPISQVNRHHGTQ